MTCTFARPDFNAAADRGGFKIYDKPRGAAENVGSELKAIHPVIRTNPVTGWKSLYPVGQHCQFINGVTEDESKMFLGWFKQLLKDNHDLQVRFKWQDVNDIAIWDNRCTVSRSRGKIGNSNRVVATRSLGLTEVTFLTVFVLILDID